MSIRLFDEQQHASLYAKFRPTYPNTVYTTIEKYYEENENVSCNRELAVDIGCGNGQSSVPLTKIFSKVIGYDVSEQQIASAPKDIQNLTFRVGPGEDLKFLNDNEVDLITVSQALHWMDLDKLYDEIRRVVRPGGVFAAYGYGNNVVDKENAQNAVTEVCIHPKILLLILDCQTCVHTDIYRSQNYTKCFNNYDNLRWQALSLCNIRL